MKKRQKEVSSGVVKGGKLGTDLLGCRKSQEKRKRLRGQKI